MDENSIRNILFELINKRLASKGGNGQEFDDNINLVEIGVIDSFGFLELISELEEKWELSWTLVKRTLMNSPLLMV